MVARFDGGILHRNGRTLARTVVGNYAGGGFDLRLSTEATDGVRLPAGMAGMGNRLSEIREWLARHPEATATRPPERIGGRRRWLNWEEIRRPVWERVEALVVRRRDANGRKIRVEVAPSFVRKNPHYIPLAGPVGPLP